MINEQQRTRTVFKLSENENLIPTIFQEVRCADFLSSVLLNCVSKETTSIVYTYFAIENALQAVENSSNICMLRELLIVLTYYENVFERLKKRNSELEV